MAMIIRFGERKIQKLGRSAYICLPQEWIRHHGLRYHDKICLKLGRGDNLILEPAAPAGDKDDAED